MKAVVKDVMSAQPVFVARDTSFKEFAARLSEFAGVTSSWLGGRHDWND